jgi:hypothetical protein
MHTVLYVDIYVSSKAETVYKGNADFIDFTWPANCILQHSLRVLCYLQAMIFPQDCFFNNLLVHQVFFWLFLSYLHVWYTFIADLPVLHLFLSYNILLYVCHSMLPSQERLGPTWGRPRAVRAPVWRPPVGRRDRWRPLPPPVCRAQSGSAQGGSAGWWRQASWAGHRSTGSPRLTGIGLRSE